MLRHAFTHSYEGFQRATSHCDVRVYEHGDHVVVVCSERPDNPGTSITSVVESLATQLWHMLGAPSLDEFIYIGHYPNRGQRREQRDGTVTWDHPENFAEVTYTQQGNVLIRSSWSSTNRRDVEELIGQRWNEVVPDDNWYQRVFAV
jgi:hypothetical protein